MIYGVYSVRDARTGFLSPTVDINDQSAIRNFVHACMNVDSLFYTHASDYDLYKIATYDTDSGVITPMQLNPIYSALSVPRKEV